MFIQNSGMFIVTVSFISFFVENQRTGKLEHIKLSSLNGQINQRNK